MQPRWSRFRIRLKPIWRDRGDHAGGSYTALRDDRGGYAIILDRMVLDHLKAMRGPGESYSVVILRLATAQ
jgi:hypothetical protein